ncbi:type II secretion system F family protein [Allonocardiopsis opalescens]
MIGLLVTVVLAAWGSIDYLLGLQQRRELASRSALAHVEYRASHPLERLDVLLRRYKWGKQIELRVARSGIKMRTSAFVLLLAAGALASIVIVWNLLAPLFGIASAVGVGFLFFSFLRNAEQRRVELFTQQLPDLARVLSNATSAGLSLPTAMAIAADELEDPAGSELRRISESLKVGQPFETAVNDLRERMPSRELGVLMSTLLVAARSGGGLVTALRHISETLEDRKETRREVRTILNESATTAWALGFLGLGSVFLMSFLMPDAVRNMTSSFIGQLVLGASVAFFVVGLIAARRMTRIKF